MGGAFMIRSDGIILFEVFPYGYDMVPPPGFNSKDRCSQLKSP